MIVRTLKKNATNVQYMLIFNKHWGKGFPYIKSVNPLKSLLIRFLWF